MHTPVLSHFYLLDGILKGSGTHFHRDLLFDFVLDLLPSSLSRSAKLFVAFIVSVLLSYGATYLWRSLFKSATTSEIIRAAGDQGEAANPQSGICERQ
jgi:hypothetical protein